MTAAGAVSGAARAAVGAYIPALLTVLAPSIMYLADTAFLYSLGKEPFLQAAAVLPAIVLLMQLSSVSLGGTITAEVARAAASTGVDGATAVIRGALVAAALFGTVYFVAFCILANPSFLPFFGSFGAAEAGAYKYGLVFCASALAMWMSQALNAALRGLGAFKAAMLYNWLVLVIYLPLATLAFMIPAAERWQFLLFAFIFPAAFLIAVPLQLHSVKTLLGASVLSTTSTWGTPVLRTLALATLAASWGPILGSLSSATILFYFSRPELSSGLPTAALLLRFEVALALILFGFGTVSLARIGGMIGSNRWSDARRHVVKAALSALVVGALILVVAGQLLGDSLTASTTGVHNGRGLALVFKLFVLPAYPAFAVGISLIFALQAVRMAKYAAICSSIRLAALFLAFVLLEAFDALHIPEAFTAIGFALATFGVTMTFATMLVYGRRAGTT